MSPCLKKPLTLAIALISYNTAAAEEKNPQSPIEEVNVWATEVKASSLDLDEDAIAIRQADHISDLLRFIPGVDVGGAHSLNQRVTIRSLDDKDLDIRIDGAVQNTYMFHHMGNLQIHSDILRKADIEVGNNSVLNGGVGGAARFETRSAKDMLTDGTRFGGRFNATYADNASERASLAAYGQFTDSIDVLGYINQVENDNYKVGGGEIKDQDGEVIANTDGTVRGLKGSLTDALIKVGFDLNQNQRLKLGYENYKDQGDYSARPDMGIATDLAIGQFLSTDSISQLYPTTFTRDTATINYDASFENLTIEAALFNNVSTLEREEAYIRNEILIEEQKEGEATNTGLSVLIEQSFGGRFEQVLSYGIETINYNTEYNGVRFSSGLSAYSHGEEKANSVAAYIQDRITVGQFRLTPGVRFSQWDIDSNLIDKTYSEPTLALAVDYAIDDATTLKVSATEIFKGPELSEVFIGAGSGDTYNEGLKAETGVNTEFGIAHQGQTFQAGVTVFETVINDYIYDYINYSVRAADFAKDNVGDMRLRGIEAFWGVSLSSLDILITYSDLNSKLSAFDEFIDVPFNTGDAIEIDEGLDGARTDRTYGATYGLNLDYSWPSINVRVHYDMMHISSLGAGKDLDGADLENSKDAYTLHNISVQWQPDRIQALSLTFGIDNLFDEYYAAQASRTGVSLHPVFGELYLTDYEPGRNVKASVAYVF